MRTVAALYIDPRGPYPKMPGVECWDEARDARLYAGPHPVVAHPPCGPWGRLSHLSFKQDPTCGPSAVAAVRHWGGVLEHPSESRLWRHCNMPRPGELPDAWGGVTLAVNQVDWGHVARKPTWLYLVGVRPEQYPRMPRREPTHWVSGSRGARKHARSYGGRIPEGIKACSAEQRRRTPPAFAEFLVSLARAARRNAVASTEHA